MGSLFAGPRTGIFAYTEKSIRVGVTFYIAIEWGQPMNSGIVEVIHVENNKVIIGGTGSDNRLWVKSIKDFLSVANNYTDLYGNPNPMIRGSRKWWQFWKKKKRGYPKCPTPPPCPLPPMVSPDNYRLIKVSEVSKVDKNGDYTSVTYTFGLKPTQIEQYKKAAMYE